VWRSLRRSLSKRQPGMINWRESEVPAAAPGGSSGPPEAPSGSRPRLSLAFGPGASRPRDRGDSDSGCPAHARGAYGGRWPPAAPTPAESDAGRAG
jgi:hypothetical protein